MKKIFKNTVPFWAALFLSLTFLPCMAQQWDEVDHLPTPLGAIDPGVWEGKIYIFGGKITELISSDTVWVYDPDAGWSYGGKMPDSLEAIIVEEYNGKFYLFGGHSHPDFVYRTEVMTFDPVTQVFDTVAYLPAAKAWLTSVVLGGKIYLMGGDNYSDATADVDIFDPNDGTWEIGPSMNTARLALSADTLNGKIYVAGGGAGVTAFNTVEIYDPAEPELGWVTSPHLLNSPRGFHSCKNIGGKLYVFGGAGGFSTPFLNSAEYFDPQTGNWLEFETMNFARRELGGAVLEGSLYALGGMIGPFGNATFLDKVERHVIVDSNHERRLASGFDSHLKNTPNPFHTNTRIEFNLMICSNVQLDIFDTNGKKVTTVLNEVLYPGRHEAVWDGSGLPAGIYFYRLHTNDFTTTKKCVLQN